MLSGLSQCRASFSARVLEETWAIKNLTWHAAHLTASIRCSHSRPQQVPGNKRNRAVLRPKETFLRQTGRPAHPASEQLHFLIAPVDPADVPSAARNPKYSHWRSRVKKARTPAILLETLKLAVAQNEVDGSVIGASMQKCGHGRWWHALMEVHKEQVQSNAELRIVERSIFLNAMASCLKDASLPDTVLGARRKEALQQGKQVWQDMPAATSEMEFNCALGSAWNLCASTGSAEACDWAIMLHEWSCTQPFQKNIVTCTSFLALLESQGYQARVDELLQRIVDQERLSLNEVVLGCLVNAAGSAFDWQRVERLWDMFVSNFRVRPNVICYTALAKAHVLSGRPAAAVDSLNAMRAAGVGLSDAQAALCYLQALLIQCHSDPTKSNLTRLMECLKWGDSTMASGSRQIRKDWEQLSALAERLAQDPTSLQFHQLLVQENAKTNGKMKGWPNHKAGSKYLSAPETPTSMP